MPGVIHKSETNNDVIRAVAQQIQRKRKVRISTDFFLVTFS